jgi:hypothetical protein
MMRKKTKVLAYFLMTFTSHCTFAVSVDNPLPSSTITKTQTLSDAISSQITAQTLKPFSANFLAYRSGKEVGTALLELKTLANSEYELRYESKLSRFFLSDKRYETTRFLVDNENLMPLEYQYKRTGTGSNKALTVKFDQANKKIHIDDNELDWNGEIDNQLFRLDFPKQLALGKTTMQYELINYRGEKRRYDLSVVSTDNLSLPYGNITAVKVNIGRNSNRRVTYAWFAPSLNFNLVRLQQFKDEKEQGDMQLNTFAYID